MTQQDFFFLAHNQDHQLIQQQIFLRNAEDILSAQLSPRAAGEGMSGSVGLEGTDGSWLILDVAAVGRFEDRHTAYHDNLSPAVEWEDVPGAQHYALIVEDPDAPREKPFVHWMV